MFLFFLVGKPPRPLSLQRQQNALKYVTEEWCQIECELLRERGLWGPPIGSHLDKWMLEMTEGPCRMRKKMVRNDMFYNHYPYVPETEQETNVTVSTRPPVRWLSPALHARVSLLAGYLLVNCDWRAVSAEPVTSP